MRSHPGGWWGSIALVVYCAVLYGPGLGTLPPVDRDEARFAQATRQMLESGDFVRISFQEEPRHKKPAGIHWLQAPWVKAAGGAGSTAMGPYRMPSALGAACAVLLLFQIGRKLFDGRTALLGAALLASSLLLVVESHLATTDAALLAAVVAAEGALGMVYVHARSGGRAPPSTALLFWAAQGAGILLKGPVVPLVSVLTIGALVLVDREARPWRALRPLLGVPLAAAIALPWLIEVTLATRGAFLADALGKDLLPRLVSGQESHGFPPGSHVLFALLAFSPGSLFLPFAILGAWRERSQPAIRFLLAWLVPTWLAFEIIPTKLPHYVLPAYPALALLTARWVLARDEDPARRAGAAGRIYIIAWSVLGAALGIAVAAAPWALEERPGTALTCASALSAMGIASSALLAGSSVFRGRRRQAALAGIAAAPLVLFPLFQVVLPGLDSLWLSRSAASAVDRLSPARASRPPAAITGYGEPSIVFLLGTGTRLVSSAEAAGHIHRIPGALAVVSEKADAGFRARLAELGAAPSLLWTVRGFNYSKGRWMTLRIYASDAPQ